MSGMAVPSTKLTLSSHFFLRISLEQSQLSLVPSEPEKLLKFIVWVYSTLFSELDATLQSVL